MPISQQTLIWLRHLLTGTLWFHVLLLWAVIVLDRSLLVSLSGAMFRARSLWRNHDAEKLWSGRASRAS